jgi:hypothetical protein
MSVFKQNSLSQSATTGFANTQNPREMIPMLITDFFEI